MDDINNQLAPAKRQPPQNMIVPSKQRAVWQDQLNTIVENTDEILLSISQNRRLGKAIMFFVILQLTLDILGAILVVSQN